MKQQYLEAGEIVNTHGIKGEVKIVPWADSADFLAGFKRLFVAGEEMKVVSSRVHKQCLIVLFDGVGDVNGAMRLKGRTVSIDRDDVTLPEGHYFIADIMGARVVSDEGEELGTLDDVIELPGHRVYSVKGKRDMLIPAVPEFIRSVDADNGVVTVHIIEGM